MIQRFGAALAALVLCLAASDVRAEAQTTARGSGLVTQTFQLGAPGNSPILSLINGQSVCSVTVQAVGQGGTAFTGLTLVPQVASDGPNNPQAWVTAPLIGGGLITTTGTYIGNVSSAGLTNFRVSIGAIATGTVTGVITCTPGNGAGSHVNLDNAPLQSYTPARTGNGAQSSQPTLSYNLGWTPSATDWQSLILDPSDVLETTSGGNKRYDLKSTSTSGSCVSLGVGAGSLRKVWNSGPATTVYLSLYDEGASPTCAAADSLFGDQATIVVPAGGSVLTFDSPFTFGLAYKLSAALSATQNIHITTFGLGL